MTMMVSTSDVPDRLNSHLMRLLGFGTWVSCTLIAAGIVLQALGFPAQAGARHLISAGIVLLIALPTLRVAVMGIWFLFHRDLEFTVIAALVLAIIAASTFFGAGAH